MEKAMSTSAWFAKLNVLPEAACRCGHSAHVHHYGKDCTALVDESRMTYCKCSSFREATKNQIEGEEMNKKTRKPKGEGRKPTLAAFVDSPFKIYMNHDGKEREAQVLSSGIIRLGEKEFTSPSSAAQAILGKNAKGKPLQADGWRAWRFNKDGERVELNVLRGAKSPLKAIAPKREKKAKTNGSKPKRVRKPRARKTVETAATQAAEAGAAA
jgi:hypothetical protein